LIVALSLKFASKSYGALNTAIRHTQTGYNLTGDSGHLASPLHVMAGLVPAPRLSAGARSKEDVDARDTSAFTRVFAAT
jgi:hypothetical protein